MITLKISEKVIEQLPDNVSEVHLIIQTMDEGKPVAEVVAGRVLIKDYDPSKNELIKIFSMARHLGRDYDKYLIEIERN